MAPGQPLQRKPRSLPQTKFFQHQKGVLGARRNKPAVRSGHRRDEAPVEPHSCLGCAHRHQPPPHPAIPLPALFFHFCITVAISLLISATPGRRLAFTTSTASMPGGNPPASAIAALSRRRTRLRSTAPPTLRDTTSPYRPFRPSRLRTMWITRLEPDSTFPLRNTCWNSLAFARVLRWSRSRLTSVRKPAAALSAATRYDCPAGPGPHPRPKSVRFLLVPFVWLICALHGFPFCAPAGALGPFRLRFRLDYNRDPAGTPRSLLASPSTVDLFYSAPRVADVCSGLFASAPLPFPALPAANFPPLRPRRPVAIIRRALVRSSSSPRGHQLHKSPGGDPALSTHAFSTPVDCPVENLRARTEPLSARRSYIPRPVQPAPLHRTSS